MAKNKPSTAAVDTTGDPELEAKWQALVKAVIDGKAAVRVAHLEVHQAQVALVNAGKQDEQEAGERVERAVAKRKNEQKRLEAAQAAMKAGDL